MIGGCSLAGKRSRGVSSRWNTPEKLVLLALLFPTTAIFHGCAGVVTAKNTSGQTTESFQLNPASVSFGKVTVGKQATQAVTVSNTGSASLNITSAHLSDAQFSVSGMPMPQALAPSQSARFNVGVAPTAAGNLTGTLTVSGDSGSTPVVVNLSATPVSGNTPHPQLPARPPSTHSR